MGPKAGANSIKGRAGRLLPVLLIATLTLSWLFLDSFGTSGNLRKALNGTYQRATVPPAEYKISGYTALGSRYRSRNDDASILWDGISLDVANVRVVFGRELEQDLFVAVYYAQGAGLSEDARVTATARRGDREVNLLLQRKVSALRFDIGNKKDEAFVLKDIVVNDIGFWDFFGFIPARLYVAAGSIPACWLLYGADRRLARRKAEEGVTRARSVAAETAGGCGTGL